MDPTLLSPAGQSAAPAPAADDATMTDAPAPAAANSSEQCVPLSALAMPDEGEQMANPAPGDTVNYEVEGKVTRVDGKMAYVQPVKVNGQDMADSEDEGNEPDEGKPTEEQQDASDYDALQQSAKQQGAI